MKIISLPCILRRNPIVRGLAPPCPPPSCTGLCARAAWRTGVLRQAHADFRQGFSSPCGHFEGSRLTTFRVKTDDFWAGQCRPLGWKMMTFRVESDYFAGGSSDVRSQSSGISVSLAMAAARNRSRPRRSPWAFVLRQAGSESHSTSPVRQLPLKDFSDWQAMKNCCAGNENHSAPPKRALLAN